jgi:hypothetical protein
MTHAAVIVTTSRRPTPELLARAQELAGWLATPLVPREGSVAGHCVRHGVRGAVVVAPERVTYYEPERGLEYFYHPGMAKLRLHNHRRGDPDPMLRAMDVHPGDEVLDCTLGRATDAILSSWAVGEAGRVLGLEVSPLLAALTRDGIAHYTDPARELTATLRRIECRCADYRVYLPDCADRSWDVVYFDPVFHEPVVESQAMAPLRLLADPSPLPAEALAEAGRVARRRVVIKQGRATPLWGELGIETVVGAPRSHVEYGVIEV